MKYFGPPKFRKDWETQIPTPVGQECQWCDVAIQESDCGTMQAVVKEVNGELVTQMLPLHHECGIRSVIGSVSHQKKLCSCFGGTQPDTEDGMTRHEAAIAAARYFYARGDFIIT